MVELKTMATWIAYRARRAQLARDRGEVGASALEWILIAVAAVTLVALAVGFIRNKINEEGSKL